MPELKLNDRETQLRLARFLIVGGTAFVVQLVAMHFTSMVMNTNVAFVLSWMCSTATHYCLNRFWALPSARTDVWRQFRGYLGATAVSLTINLSLFHLCLDGLGLSKLWATAVAVPPSTVVVFLILNYRVFRAKV